MKTSSEAFKKELSEKIEKLKDKKVLIYGAGAGFKELNKQYNFADKLNIIGIADKKFEENGVDTFLEMKAIKPDEISNTEYDVILVTNEWSKGIINYLTGCLNIDEEKIERIFIENIPDEISNYNYLCEYNFEKHLEKLKKKLKNKTIVIYGAGIFFEAIKEYFNLDGLNIIGIADRKFADHKEDEECFGYKVYSPEEIKAINPDYVLVATKFFINIIEDLYYNTLNGTKIQIKPLMKKPFMTLLKEIWG